MNEYIYKPYRTNMFIYEEENGDWKKQYTSDQPSESIEI